MKNQNDMIISVSVVVVAAIVAAVIFFTAPTPVKPADPTPVDTSTPKTPAGDVVFANALPGGSSQSAGGGMGRGMMGGPGGMGRFGAPGGMGAPGGPGGKPRIGPSASGGGGKNDD